MYLTQDVSPLAAGEGTVDEKSRTRWKRDGTPLLLSLLAALGAVNRMDSILLFVPALACVLFERRTWRCLLSMAFGTLPLVLWIGFSLFYYGFPFPNTAYAKLNNDIPAGALAAQGCYYLWNSLKHDPITIVAIVGSVTFAIRQRRPRYICVAAGIILYLLYIVSIGGDFMSGRFLTTPLFAAVCLLGLVRWKSARVWGLAACGVVVLGLLSPRPFGRSEVELDPMSETALLRAIIAERGICDEHACYYSGTGLLAAWRRPHVEYPCFRWAAAGRNLQAIAATFQKKLIVGFEAVGLCGFYAGADVWIVDHFALGDPLLARLPPAPDPFWRIGHFLRTVPSGYLATLRGGKNALADPALADYYHHLAIITRGSLWSWSRLAAIWNMNLGRYDQLLEPARRRIHGMIPPEGQLAPEPSLAVRELSRKIEAHPKEPLLYACRAKTYAGMDDHAKAIRDVTRLIALDPRSAPAFGFRGRQYIEQGEFAKAMEDINRALEIDPYASEAYDDRGSLCIKRGQYTDASADFGRAIDADPDAISALLPSQRPLSGIRRLAARRWRCPAAYAPPSCGAVGLPYPGPCAMHVGQACKSLRSRPGAARQTLDRAGGLGLGPGNSSQRRLPKRRRGRPVRRVGAGGPVRGDAGRAAQTHAAAAGRSRRVLCRGRPLRRGP